MIFDAPTSESYCRQHAPGFTATTRGLPAARRRDVLVATAWLLRTERSIHVNHERGGKDVQQEVVGLMQQVGELFLAAPPPGFEFPALAEVARSRAINRTWFTEYVDGLNLDLVRHGYRDWTQLQQYCYKRATAPALILLRAMDVPTDGVRAQAMALGNAWSLAGFARGFAHDLQRGKIYFPQEDLARFVVEEADLRATQPTEKMRSLLLFEIDRAQREFAKGESAVTLLPDDGTREWAARYVAERKALLERVAKDPQLAYTPLEAPPAPGFMAKIRGFFRS